MKLIIQLFACLILLSCGRNPTVKSDYDNIIDNEIAGRFELLAQIGINDSISQTNKISYTVIHEEVSNLILLTKDVENSGAILNKVNMYFKDAVSKYHVPYDGFMILEKNMSLATIETAIKTNELNLLDKILFSLKDTVNQSVNPSSVY